MKINKLTTIEEVNKVLEDSKNKLQVILKHSTQCPISSDAYDQYLSFNEKHANVSCSLVYVIEDRPVSNYIEEITTFRHESPQIIIYKDGEVLANFSHRTITSEKIESYL